MLCEQGLNMFSVLKTSRVPKSFNVAVQQAGLDVSNYPSLILIGHGGNVMWRSLREHGLAGANPVDTFSLLQATQFIGEYMDDCPYEVLYPGDIPIPLQQLGALAGWHHPSPLGVGVSERFGPWFSYRVVMLVQAELAEEVTETGESPCAQCVDKPCVSTCPAQALSAAGSPNVSACVDYRLKSHSPCELSCLARLACPVGASYRYDDEQLHYFYRHSLASIKSYLAVS